MFCKSDRRSWNLFSNLMKHPKITTGIKSAIIEDSNFFFQSFPYCDLNLINCFHAVNAYNHTDSEFLESEKKISPEMRGQPPRLQCLLVINCLLQMLGILEWICAGMGRVKIVILICTVNAKALLLSRLEVWSNSLFIIFFV